MKTVMHKQNLIRFKSKMMVCGSVQKKITSKTQRETFRKYLEIKTLHVKLIYHRLIVAVWVDQESEKHPLCNSNFQENDS